MALTKEQKVAWRQLPHVRARQRQHELDYRAKHADRIAKDRKQNKAWHSGGITKNKQLYADTRHVVIVILGGKCCRCGFDDEDVLQIDHIVPIGKGRETKDGLYNKIIDGKTHNLQLLCANCHAKKSKHEDDANRRMGKSHAPLPLFDIQGPSSAKDINHPPTES